MPPRRFRGLRRTLKAACFPDYDYKRSLRVCPQFAGQKKATGLSRPQEGAARGKLVHDQLRLLVNGGGMAAIRAAYGANAGPCRELKSFLDALEYKGFVPVLSEFSDFYSQHGIASAIDLVVMSRKTGKVELIELKVGGDNYFRRSSGPLRAPAELRHLNNCPLNQAFLQLAFYRKMVTDHYTDLEIGSCYVAQVTMSGVDFCRLPDVFIRAQTGLLACVVSALPGSAPVPWRPDGNVTVMRASASRQ